MFEESKHPRDNEGKFTDKLKSAVKIYSDVPDKDMAGMGLERGKDTYSLPDEVLPKSLSARWINQDIKMPDGTVAHFVEGSKLHNIEVFAGKGTKTPIRDVERLVKKYGGQVENWQKVKGIGMINHNEEEAEAELHWYYEPSQGKQEIKFKRYL